MTPGGDALRRGGSRLALFVALALLTRAPFLTVPFLDLDEAAALLGSWTLLEGGTLYVDFVDNRPPLLYGLYAFGQLLFGRGMLAVRLMTGLIVVPLTALAASAFFRHDRRGLVAGVLYLVYGAAFLAHDMHAVSAEVLMLLPLAWAVALLSGEAEARRPGHLFVAGLLLGLAVLVRQHALVWLPALALGVGTAAGSRGHRLGRVVLLLAGVVVPLAGCAVFFAAPGAVDALVYWTVTHNLGYAANPIPPAYAVERAASSLLPFLLATLPLWDLLMADLERTRPAFVLDTAPAGLHGWDRYPMADFPRLEGFVRSDYRAIADVDGVWIWRRKGCERAGPPPE